VARAPFFRKRRAARVAKAAGLDLLANRCRREGAPRISGFRVERPSDTLPFIKLNKHPLVAVLNLAEWPPSLP
jgi:hypothetical protein